MVFSGRDADEKGIAENEEPRTLLTIAGNKARVEGKFDISQSIEVGCEVIGELKVDGQIVIQKEGSVSADVTTIDAKIIGKFDGNLKGTGKVEITETGVANGNIKTDSLVIKEGGIFSGKVTRISQEKKKAKKKSKSKEESGKEVEMPEESDEEEFQLGDIEDNMKL
ncbi:MAG: polymer-forming cytoskeletal protein [Actinomycetota bacterium]|nr:polymer-forming cytoskeletal protein [Actinomycetota bacterium]